MVKFKHIGVFYSTPNASNLSLDIFYPKLNIFSSYFLMGVIALDTFSVTVGKSFTLTLKNAKLIFVLDFIT